jgi:recombination protein RecT
MTVKTAVEKAEATRDEATGQGRTVTEMLRSLKPQLEIALPRHVDPDRFLRLAVTTVRTTPGLQRCEPMSLLGAVMQAAQLGLEIDARGLAFLVPYRNECQFQLGYQGMLELARRDGRVTSAYAYAVYEGDQFHYELGLNPTLSHVPSGDEPDDAKLRFAYAVAHLRDAEPIFVVLSRGQIDRYRKRSPAANAKSGPWVTDFESMCLKTAVRRLARWLPQSPDLATAANVDEQTVNWSAAEGVEIVDTNAIDTTVTDPDPEPDPEPAEPQPAETQA